MPRARVASPHWLPIVATADAQTGTDLNNLPHGITAAFMNKLITLLYLFIYANEALQSKLIFNPIILNLLREIIYTGTKLLY